MGRETTRKPPEAGCRLGGPARGLGLGSLSLANLNLKHVLLGIQKNVQTGLLTVQKTVNLWRSTRVGHSIAEQMLRVGCCARVLLGLLGQWQHPNLSLSSF